MPTEVTSRKTGLHQLAALQRWIRITCQRAKLNVRFEDGIPTAYTTRDCIYIPRPIDGMSEDDEWLLRFQVCHEADGHQVEGHEIFQLMEDNALDMRQPLGAILNMIEDQRIERAAARRYKGNAIVISNGREVTGKRSLDMTREITSNPKLKTLNDNTAKLQACYLTALIAEAEWCVGASLHLADEVDLMTTRFPVVADYMKKLIGFGMVPKIGELGSTDESFDLAKQIYGLLWDKASEQVEQEIADAKEQREKERREGKGEDGRGDPSDGAAEPQEGEVQVTSMKDGKPMSGWYDPRTGELRIPYSYFVKSNHDNGETGGDMCGHGLGIDWDKYEGGNEFIPFGFNEFVVRDYKIAPPSRRGRLHAFGGVKDQMMMTSSFANKMRRYLQVKSAVRYTSNERKGILNPLHVYRVGMPWIGDGEWNTRVFKTRHASDILDCSVSLIGDMSGSMSGPKTVHTAQSMILLNHVISNVLHVNTELLTFTFLDAPHVNIIKAYGERASDDDIYHRMDDAAHEQWGNDDADVILWAYDRILRQRTKRKVMIVLSDGSPADGYKETDPDGALKLVVNRIESEKRASIIGIGIMDPSVHRYYKENTTIKTADQLEDCLVSVITKKIVGLLSN